MSGAFNFGALGQINWFREGVPQLPMPVVDRNTQDGLLPAIGAYQAILKCLSPRVHMRMQAPQLYIVAHVKCGIHFVIRIAWRDLERSGGSGESQDAVF